MCKIQASLASTDVDGSFIFHLTMKRTNFHSIWNIQKTNNIKLVYHLESGPKIPYN